MLGIRDEFELKSAVFGHLSLAELLVALFKIDAPRAPVNSIPCVIGSAVFDEVQQMPYIHLLPGQVE